MEKSAMTRILNSGRGQAAWRGSRFIGKALVAAACVTALALAGCSQKAGKTSKTVVPTDPEDPGIKKVVTKLDSLVQSNKGKGVVTGFLTGEGKSLAAGILGKRAANAAGERRLLTKTEIPLSGATILIFNALKPTTTADTTLKTDTSGTYTAVLPEGKYFGFAVYLDLETFQLVTTSIPNMNPKADTIVKMDTATAIEDVTAPSVAGVYDAAAANSDGIFLVGSVPDKNAKINVAFSEPMNRDSYKGVVLGRIDTANTSTSMVLADTVKGATVSWSGDSKELTLTVAALQTGVQYGLILPTTLKDLAKNPLEKEYKATFVTVAAAELDKVDFQVASTFPADKETLKPIQNPGISFNRPVDAFTVLKYASLSPAVTGYWEVNGARAVFIHKEPLAVGKTYTVSLPTGVTDLAGKALGGAYSYSFTVKDFEGAAKDNTGKERDVALAVEAAFDAYLSGDIGRFANSFHPNFRLYEEGTIKSKTEFLDNMRKDVAEKASLASGILAPVFYDKSDKCNELHSLWKVLPQGGSGDAVWVSAFLAPGQIPMVYDKDFAAIAQASLTWDKTGPRFTYNGKVYGYGPDMSKFSGPVNMDAAKQDGRFMSDILKQTSTVALEPIKLETKDEFKVDAAVTLSGDTAKLAVKMIGYSKYSRTNFQDRGGKCSSESQSDTSYQVLKFILVTDGAKWLISSIVGGDRVENRADFDKADTKNFQVKEILPITLLAPLKNDAMTAEGKVAFKLVGPKHDSIGGYLVGLAEDPKFCFGRPPFGAVIFVKAGKDTTSFVLNSAGIPEGSNATVILRRVQDLKLPGWDRVMFENAITALYDKDKGFGGVYNWKAIAIKDTSATQFLANGFNGDRFYAESDFGPTRGYFACKAFPQGDAAFNALQTAQTTYVNTQPAQTNTFSDMDQDGVPDGIETKYKTDMRDRNSYPDFRTDTDGDGLADFLEAMLDKTGADSLVFKTADEAKRKDEIAKLIAAGIVWQDSDSDGFPDDIEMMMGFNPMDPKNNPGTRTRATSPVGVFAGKFQMGSNLNAISFRLYLDSTKALMVAYTAVVGSDTLLDTLKTLFNEMSGEVYIPVVLKTGPDAGKCLLMRGRYDQNMALVMGPIDMIAAPAKGSTNFGGGPYIGQFAASGRGEDVTRYLPNNNGGTTGPIANNPVNNPPASGPMGYRPPPQGTDTGAVILFDGKTVTYIDAFGDTLAVTPGAMFRGQPDGSFDYDADYMVKSADGKTFKHTQAGGHVFFDGQGNWVVDGHFFQESDSNGIHKSIPGQMCGRIMKANFSISLDGAKGRMMGWIFQDKTGGGFVSNPTNTQPVCDPTRGPCTTQPVCDPAKGPCNTDPNQCPAGQVCNPVNPSFGRTFMAGAANYRMFVTNKLQVREGEFFFVSLGGRVYRAKNDSVSVSNALSPMCGQVALKIELLPMKDGSDISKQARNVDSMGMQMGQSIVVAMEDQFIGGQPSMLDKARDSYGDVHSGVLIVEMRPVGMDYGKSGSQCPINNGPIVQNPCDPAKGPCPIDTAKCDPTRQTCTQPVCDPTKQVCTQPVCDPTKQDCTQPCDPTKQNCTQPPPCDPLTQNCNPQPGGQPVLYMGSLDSAKAAVTRAGGTIGVVKDSTGAFDRVQVNLTSMFKDQVLQYLVIADANGTRKFSFVADPADKNRLVIRDGYPMAVPAPGQPTNNPPPDTGKVVTNPPDTTKPPVYKGTLENLQMVLNQKNWKAVMPSPQGPVPVNLLNTSLHLEGSVYVAADAGNATRLFIFMGDKMDPSKPALDPNGMPMVTEKVLTAGP